MNPVKSSEIEIKPNDDLKSIRASQRRLRALEGAVLGTLCGLILFLLGVNELVRKDLFQDIFVIPALVGCGLSVSPLRKLFWAMTAGLVCAFFIVGYTPLAPRLQQQLLRKDALAKAPAVVVLSTYLQSDGTLNSAAQERTMQGYILLKQDWANRLVLTANATDFGSQAPAIQSQMAKLGLNSFPVDVVGHVRDTHDEALAVAQLAKERGWPRVLLVTHPMHMRRAAGVFEKAGLQVICSPCAEGEFDMQLLTTPNGRLHSFRYWLHETVGIAIYRMRGWM